MKHLKLFQTESEYIIYKDGADFVAPNVSYTIDSEKVFYSPSEESAKLIKEILVDSLGIEMDFGMGWWTCWQHDVQNDTKIEGCPKNVVLRPKDSSMDISNKKCAMICYVEDLDETYAYVIDTVTVQNNYMTIDNNVLNEAYESLAEYYGNTNFYGMVIGEFVEYDDDGNEIIDAKAIDTIMEYELI